MQSSLRINRGTQIVAWFIAALFISGFFAPFVGMWTNTILGVWFVGTQKPRRGFFWMLVFAFVPSLFTHLRKFPLASPQQALIYAGSLFLAALLGVLPFTFHRLSSRGLPGFVATLPFPLAAVVVQILVQPMLGFHATRGDALLVFLIGWFAATIVGIWNREFAGVKSTQAAILSVAIFVLAASDLLVRRFTGALLLDNLRANAIFAWISSALPFFSAGGLPSGAKSARLGLKSRNPSPGCRVR